MSDYQLNQYSREEIVETLKRIRKEYPAAFEHFFMFELRKQPIILSSEEFAKFNSTK